MRIWKMTIPMTTYGCYYIMHLTTLADQLAAVNVPTADDELIAIILASLQKEYNNSIASLGFQTNALMFDAVSVHLLQEESRSKEVTSENDIALMAKAKPMKKT
jgi:hypothetical protein